MKQRIIEFLSYLGIGQNKFEKSAGLANGLISSSSGNMTLKSIEKIAAAYPELNINWLRTGEGEMLNPVTISQHGRRNVQVSGQVTGLVGDMHGGTFNHNGGKDQVIERQEKEVSRMFEVVLDEIHGFQDASKRHDDYVVRQDDYIKKQDEYVANIIKNSYLRNRENMERIDKLIEAQNNLMTIIVDQDRRIQDRADRLFELMEKKIGV